MNQGEAVRTYLAAEMKSKGAPQADSVSPSIETPEEGLYRMYHVHNPVVPGTR